VRFQYICLESKATSSWMPALRGLAQHTPGAGQSRGRPLRPEPIRIKCAHRCNVDSRHTCWTQKWCVCPATHRGTPIEAETRPDICDIAKAADPQHMAATRDTHTLNGGQVKLRAGWGLMQAITVTSTACMHCPIVSNKFHAPRSRNWRRHGSRMMARLQVPSGCFSSGTRRAPCTPQVVSAATAHMEMDQVAHARPQREAR